MTANLYLIILRNPRWMKISVLNKRISVFITYHPYAEAGNNTPFTFTKFAELPNSEIPWNLQYGTITNNYIDFF